jgi:hypothetical protein
MCWGVCMCWKWLLGSLRIVIDYHSYLRIIVMAEIRVNRTSYQGSVALHGTSSEWGTRQKEAAYVVRSL